MSRIMFLVSTGGIYISYLTMSVYSEKLYSYEYQSIHHPEKRDRYTDSLLAVWLGALLCTIFGSVRSLYTKQKKNPIPLKEELTLGFLYTVNILCTNLALLYLTYPVQVLGRQTRLLAVILVGVFFSRVAKGAKIKLRASKVITGLIITAGVLLFNFAKIVMSFSIQSSSKDQLINQSEIWKGYALLLVSILADAFFSDSQAYEKEHFHPTANHLFTSANLYTFVLCIGWSILSGSLNQQIGFCLEHPDAFYDLLLIGCLQVLGQVSIYYVVANFKQHVFPIISTTRKIATFVISVIIYKHLIGFYQWVAIAIVFGGVVYEFVDEGWQKRTIKKSNKF